MLTIKTNMEYKSLVPICGRSNPLSEKIMGEYELMRADFEPEELLHLITSSPDIYYNEGPVTNLISENRVTNNQKIKLDVINNMINRIMFSGTVKPTYRDTVYVENVLRKLGITDVKQFLRQVNLTINEDNATTRLLELYNDSVQELRTVTMAVAEENKKKAAEKKTEEKREKEENEPALYNEIFKRLETAVIYSELYNIKNTVINNNRPVSPEQLENAGEDKFARNVLLSVFRNYVRNEQIPLTYRNYNIYEEGGPGDTITTKSNISNLISSAVLLNHIDKAYRLYSNSIQGERNEWFDYSRSFFGSEKDTIERIRERVYNGENVYVYDRNLLELSKEQKTTEVSLLTRLVHYIHEDGYYEGDTVLEEGDSHYIDAARQIIEKLGDITVKKQTPVFTENIYNRLDIDARSYSEPQEGDVYTVRNMRPYNTSVTEEGGRSYYSESTHIRNEGSKEYYDSDVDITYTDQEGDISIDESSTQINENNIKAYKQALDIINEQNLERITQLANRLPEETKKSIKGEVRLDRSQALIAAEDILSGKSPLEIEYLKEGKEIEKTKSVYETAAMNVMSERTKQIMETVHEYMENPVKTIAEGKIRPSDPARLAADIRYLELDAEKEAGHGDGVRQTAEKIIDEVTDQGTVRRRNTRRSKFEYDTDNVSLVHKQERNLDEAQEIIEELHRQNTAIKRTNEEVQNNIENVNITKTNVMEQTTINNEILSSTEVNRMISDRFREDMDEISEKVFDRIERKLVSERKRRGF
ncbi:MAG: hypothetical protein K6E95_03780 [Lachnospiraceae bacterium]|nr:hypothetical protein [Lachnospiraceae bacterium]